MTQTHAGSRHCRALRYEVDLALEGRATRCNCTACTKLGLTGAIVKPEAFRRLGAESAHSVSGPGPVMRRCSCGRCGTHCYAVGELAELGGALVGINVNTLDDVDVGLLQIAHWDGRHDNGQARGAVAHRRGRAGGGGLSIPAGGG